jgi:DNA-binding NarL/FixJ family response regulator
MAPSASTSSQTSQASPHRQPAILAVGLNLTGEHAALNVRTVPIAREALKLLRRLRFDLVLVAWELPDMSPWDLAATIRHFWPWQRWMLIGSDLDDANQRRACELGASGVFDSIPPDDQLGWVFQK